MKVEYSDLEICDLELSKLLKELNFNWDSDYYFDKEEDIVEMQYYHYAKNYTDYNNWPENIEYFSPYLEVVAAWFRKIHKIAVLVSFNDNTSFEYYYFIHTNISKAYSNRICSLPFISKNYEEALLVGLKEACKLIKK